MKTARTISTFDFASMFPSGDAAREYIEGIRWPDGPVCPECGGIKSTPWKSRPGSHQCKDCRKIYTVRVGTIFESTRLPLDRWLYAIYLLQTARKGISSLQLSKEIGTTQKTAWFLLHRIREACGDSLQAVPLSGVVESDETYIGGRERNKRKSKRKPGTQGGAGKQAVHGLRERGGRVRASAVQRVNADTLTNRILDNVAPGSTLCTDEHAAYSRVPKMFYEHERVNHSAAEYVRGMAHTNGIESVWAVIKRGFNGTYHNWSVKHCQRYINEFTFRLNDGDCSIDTMDRIRSVIFGAIGRRLTYDQLTA